MPLISPSARRPDCRSSPNTLIPRPRLRDGQSLLSIKYHSDYRICASDWRSVAARPMPRTFGTMATGSLRERKKERTRATLTEVSAKLFSDQGYAATTLDQIAAAAEISVPTLLVYFESK